MGGAKSECCAADWSLSTPEFVDVLGQFASAFHRKLNQEVHEQIARRVPLLRHALAAQAKNVPTLRVLGHLEADNTLGRGNPDFRTVVGLVDSQREVQMQVVPSRAEMLVRRDVIRENWSARRPAVG